MNAVLSPSPLAAGLTELWSPRVIGEGNDAYVKVVKVQGSPGTTTKGRTSSSSY